MTEQVRCRICDSGRTKREGSYLVCADCGHTTYETDIDLLAYHAGEEYRRKSPKWIGSDGLPSERWHKKRRRQYVARAEFLKPYLAGVASGFDIGCSAGGFAREILPYVPDVSGIELSEMLAQVSNSRGTPCVVADFMAWEPPRKWDAVFAFHVMEHVRDAVAFALKASSIATKVLVLEIPVKEQMFPEFGGHIHWFSRPSWDVLLAKIGRPILAVRRGFTMHHAFFAVLGEKQ